MFCYCTLIRLFYICCQTDSVFNDTWNIFALAYCIKNVAQWLQVQRLIIVKCTNEILDDKTCWSFECKHVFLLLNRLTYVVYWRYGDDNCSLEAALKLSVLRTLKEMNCIVGLHSCNLFYP